jgi:thiosulfate reductase cytochrome b subunit
MPPLGKTLILLGLLIMIIGILITFDLKVPWLGRLPGDIYIKRDNFTFYFPLATSILISLIVTLLLWLFRR